tara:strand:+ start:611 stop:2218 length:1608 start_codon:yes stop_codon:yes gene_type:complete
MLKNYLIILKAVFKKNIILAWYFIFLSLNVLSQNKNSLFLKVDTTKIKIGEKIDFQLNIVFDKSKEVIFLDSIFYNPFEIIEDFELDTIQVKSGTLLTKKYSITSFEAGNFYLKPKRVDIDGKVFQSDSVLIEISTVKVDTVSKKFFDIKEIIQVQENNDGWWVTYLIGSIAVFLLFLFFKIYKTILRSKETNNQNQEPIEKAISALQLLESKNLKEQLDYKNYYSSLTEIVKNYFEEEVCLNAMESTSKELINKLELLKDSGRLSLKPKTIDEFRSVLETADLVKFAKTNPGSDIAFSDKKVLEKILIDTKEAIPEPTEEELMKNQEYVMTQNRKNRIKLLKKGAFIFFGSLSLVLIISIISFGWKEVSDTLFGNKTKTLINKTWVNSKYGAFPINLSTPNVLVRTDSVGSFQNFESGKIEEILYTALKIRPNEERQKQITKQEIIDQVILDLREIGATNILTKENSFVTQGNETGLKVFGSFDYQINGEKTRKDYSSLDFRENNGKQNILIVFDRNDDLLKKIIERIENSIKF